MMDSGVPAFEDAAVVKGRIADSLADVDRVVAVMSRSAERARRYADENGIARPYDAVAALLDRLEIGDVSIIGVSGGGPTALQFALRHPQRTRALVMVAAIARRYTPPGRTTDSLYGLFHIFKVNGFGKQALDMCLA